MAATTNYEKSLKELLIHKSWQYLHDNFHKFTETNKIKIALELCKKDLPNQIEGEVKFTQMPEIKVAGKPLEIKIGG